MHCWPWPQRVWHDAAGKAAVHSIRARPILYALLYCAGYTLCGDSPNAVCLNLQTDPQHCGTCTTACTGNNECTAGSCSCKQGFANCAVGSTSCETDLQSDAAHCGACGNACPAGDECQAGMCACPSGAPLLPPLCF